MVKAEKKAAKKSARKSAKKKAAPKQEPDANHRSSRGTGRPMEAFYS